MFQNLLDDVALADMATLAEQALLFELLDSTLLLFRHHDEAVDAASGSVEPLERAVDSLLTLMRGQCVSIRRFGCV